MLYLLAIIIGVIIGGLVGWLLASRKATALFAQLQIREQQLADRQREYEEQIERREQLYQQQLAELKAHHQEQQQQQQKAMESQKATMDANFKLLREQMTSASEQVLKQRASELEEENLDQLAKILSPLQTDLRQMRETVARSNADHTERMTRLDQSIKENLRQSQVVSERADSLTQALRGDSKQQGNFGEMRLRQLLEQLGFQEGLQFEEQQTLRSDTGQALTDEEGHRLIPDVILHFPDDRDVIIDSKVSLTAYEAYFAATTDIEKDAWLKRHVESLRAHVNELSRKNYSAYIRQGRKRLDFVLMYVFNDGAVNIATAADRTLWQEAYDKGVFIVGTQNLYMTLRVLELMWRQQLQVENQEAIMEKASEIVNRVQLFYERFEKVDAQLTSTRRAFDELKQSTAQSGMSITTAARQLVKLGAKENPKRKLRLPTTEDGQSLLPVDSQQPQ